MSKIYLLSCVSQKADKRCRAGDMYTSALFKKSLEYAEKHKPDKILILSAKHHLLNLDDVIAPYDLTLANFSAEERQKWGVQVIKKLSKVADLENDTFVVMAGENYLNPIKDSIKRIRTPMKGLGIGERLGFLTEETELDNVIETLTDTQLDQVFKLLESEESEGATLFEDMTALQAEPALVEGFEPGNEKHFYIRGKFATIEAVNNNKRFYPRHLWEREVAKYQDEIARGTINTLMEWNHPKDRLSVDPSQAVAKVTKLWIEGDYVMGEAVIFDGTPIANTIKSLIKYGVQISVSSRAAGKTDSRGVVQEFKLISFDLVANPSDPNATMHGIYESCEDNPGPFGINQYEQLLNNQIQKGESLMNNNQENPQVAGNGDIGLYESLLDMIRTKDAELTDLRRETEIFRNRFEEEERDYTMRREAENLSQTHRHQDASNLVDTDPASEVKSGEDDLSKVISLLQTLMSRADVVGASLNHDVDTIDKPLNRVSGISGDVAQQAAQAETGAWAEKKIDPADQRIFDARVIEVSDILDPEGLNENAQVIIGERIYRHMCENNQTIQDYSLKDLVAICESKEVKKAPVNLLNEAIEKDPSLQAFVDRLGEDTVANHLKWLNENQDYHVQLPAEAHIINESDDYDEQIANSEYLTECVNKLGHDVVANHLKWLNENNLEPDAFSSRTLLESSIDAKIKNDPYLLECVNVLGREAVENHLEWLCECGPEAYGLSGGPEVIYEGHTYVLPRSPEAPETEMLDEAFKPVDVKKLQAMTEGAAGEVVYSYQNIRAMNESESGNRFVMIPSHLI